MDKYQNEDLETMTEPKWQLLTTSFKQNKPIDKVRGISELILLNDPDICLFTEVGGENSLENFTKYFLKDKYISHHFPSNSDRGIDLGIIYKKEISSQMKFKHHNHKVFARGVLQSQFTNADGKQINFLLTHLKSKLNKENDFEGRSQREREVNKLIDIYQKLPSDQPNFICGDLNGIIYKNESEFELEKFATKTGLIDIFEGLDLPYFERATYLYYNKGGDSNLMQLDYVLCDPQWIKKLSLDGLVLDFDGKPRVNFPVDLKSKIKCPSDHYPIFFKINLS